MINLIDPNQIVSVIKTLNNKTMNTNFNVDVDLEPSPISDQELLLQDEAPKSARGVQERTSDVLHLKECLPDLRLNLLTNKIEYGSRTTPVIMRGDDLETMTVKLALEQKVYIPEGRVRVAARHIAKENAYCPIKRYLMECCYNNTPFPQWDNLGEYLLGKKDELSTKILQRFFIGAVARAYDPGCTMSWIPILIGKQGCGKSQLIRELVPPDLYAEITIPLELLIKEIYRLHISWIAELPEVDNYFSVRNIENFKNLITTRVDETRIPYQQLPISMERRFVMVGTSNRSEFLVDPTGNRRYIPLELGENFETPWRELKHIREPLWKRAVQEYQKGTNWEITSGEIAQISDYIQSFAITDPWESIVSQFIQEYDEIHTTKILIEGLSFSPQSVSRRDSTRIGSIMTSLGWRRISTTRDGRKVRLWKRPKDQAKKSQSLTDF